MGFWNIFWLTCSHRIRPGSRLWLKLAFYSVQILHNMPYFLNGFSLCLYIILGTMPRFLRAKTFFFNNYLYLLHYLYNYISAVSRKWFGSADCDSICTIYLSLCTHTADPNPIWGKHWSTMLFTFVYRTAHIYLCAI